MATTTNVGVLTLVIVIIIILAGLSPQRVNAQPPTTELELSNRDAAPPDPADGGQITTEKPESQPPPPSDVGAVGGAPASDGANIGDSVHNPDQNALRRRRRQEVREQFFNFLPDASQGNGGTADASADTGMPEPSLPDPVTAVTADSGNTAPPVSPVTPNLGTAGSYSQAESMEEVIQGSGDASICPSGSTADTGLPEPSLPVPVISDMADCGNTTSPVSPVTPDLGTTGSYLQPESMEVTQGSGDADICPSGSSADTGMPESSLPDPVTAVTADSGNTAPPVSSVTPDLGTASSCSQPESMEESGDINVHGPNPANLLNHILMSCGAWLQPLQAYYNQDIDLGRERQLRERRLQERQLQEEMATYWNWVSQIAIAYYYFGSTDSGTMKHGSAVFMFHRMLAIMTLLCLLSFFGYFSSE